MRWRNGLMVWVDEVVMALLLLGNEADCLIPQRRQQNRYLNHSLTPDRSVWCSTGNYLPIVGWGRQAICH